MDSVTLATVTAALTLLGTECAKGVASQAGKDLWSRAKGLLGWAKEPQTQELPRAIATKLSADYALTGQLVTLLREAKSTDSSVQLVGSLVGTLFTDKAVVTQNFEGVINM